MVSCGHPSARALGRGEIPGSTGRSRFRHGRRAIPAGRHRPSYAAANARRSPAGSPLIARNNVRAGPLGFFFTPRSHSRNVHTLNSNAAANCAWVIPVARLIARTSTSDAVSGAASGLAAI